MFIAAGLVHRLSDYGRAVQSRPEYLLPQGIDARFCAAAVCCGIGCGHVRPRLLYDQISGRRAALVDDCARQVDHGNNCDGLLHAPGGMWGLIAARWSLDIVICGSSRLCIQCLNCVDRFHFCREQISTQSFLLFSCKRMGLRPDDLYLYADLTQQCWTVTHWSWALGLGVRFLTFLFVPPYDRACTIIFSKNVSHDTYPFGLFLLMTDRSGSACIDSSKHRFP
jgi:hypothetical protein